MEFKFACPHCGQNLSTSPVDIGSTANCPACNNELTVPSAALSPNPAIEHEGIFRRSVTKSRLAQGALTIVAIGLSVWLLRIAAVKAGVLGPHSEEPSKSSLEAHAVATQPASERKLVIKGLSLGMKGTDAAAILRSHSMDRWTVTSSAFDGWYDVRFRSYALMHEEAGGIAVDMDTDTVREFYFMPLLSDYLFESKDMSPKAFAQTFIDAYDIPNLKPTTMADGKSVWRYDSPGGWTLLVSADKRINVFVSAKRKFD